MVVGRRPPRVSLDEKSQQCFLGLVRTRSDVNREPGALNCFSLICRSKLLCGVLPLLLGPCCPIPCIMGPEF